MDSHRGRLDRRLVGRAALQALVVILSAILAIEVAIGISVIGGNGDIGIDYRFYRDAAAGWLADGQFYLPHQLEGPYRAVTLVEVLYPPNALFLFVPFVFLPAILWWAIPVAVLAYVIVGWRPRLWTLPVILVCLMWVNAFGAYLWGNTDMWTAASIAAGLRWGWPVILVALKPSELPFLLIGVRRRSAWVAGAMLTAASAFLGPMWPDYVTAIGNMEPRLDYSLGSLSLLLLPVVAWLGRSRPGVQMTRTPIPGSL